jgi:uroporphyrinogen III methyltransferase/synthase
MTPKQQDQPERTPKTTDAGEANVTTAKTRKKGPLGSVALVAAGPGDPDLLTLRAAALLAEADVVLSDADALPLAKLHVRPEAELRPVGKGAGALDHDEVGRRIVDAAREGRRVVRFVAGDPIVDGTVLHEAAALRRAKIPFEVAPGVSVVTGVPAYAGFGLTGGRTRQIHVVDAHDPDLVWADLAKPRTTVVFLNGAETASTIAARLMSAGAGEDVPVAVTRGGTTVDQRTIVGTLAEIGTLAKGAKGAGVVVVGDVVAQREKLDWFESKPLLGWRILIPRTQEQAGPVSSLLRRRGAVPMEVPTISVEPPRTPQQMDRAIHGLVSGRFEWIGFTSVNAVRAIREKLVEYGLDARSFAGLKVAAVGELTVSALVEFGGSRPVCRADDECTARGLAPVRLADRPHQPRVPAARRHRDRHAGRRSRRARLGG